MGHRAPFGKCVRVAPPMKRRHPEDDPDFAASDPGDGSDLNVDTSYTRAHTRRQRSGGGSSAWLPWTLLMLGAVAAGLVDFWFVEPLRGELRQTREFLNEANTNVTTLQNQVAQLTATQEQLLNAHDALESTLAQREADLENVQKAQEELAQKLQLEVDRGNVAIHQSEGELVVDLIDQVLFDSGEANINMSGKLVLRNVGETLRKVPNKIIEVRGHTDAAPIAPALTKRYPTNWELSTERATNVVRFLSEGVGVPGDRLVAAGYAEFRPVADNKTPAGRRRNRRIEVVLLAAHPKQPP